MLQEIELDRDSTRPETAEKALRDGCFLVRHSIPSTLLDDAYGLLEDFFRLPAEVKAESAGPAGGLGFVPASPGAADWKELFHWGAQLPDGHPLLRRFPDRYPRPVWPDHLVPGFSSVLKQLHGEMRDFQLKVVDTISRMIGVDGRFFREMLTDGPVVNRASWYPPMESASSDQQVWAVAHTDQDLITMLPRATSGGLEVLTGGTWVPVTPPDGHAVINAGVVLERLSNGRITAPLHRVSAPSNSTGRLSIVQFCHPTPWTVISPLQHDGGREVPEYPAITAADLFDKTMYERHVEKDQILTGAGQVTS